MVTRYIMIPSNTVHCINNLQSVEPVFITMSKRSLNFFLLQLLCGYTWIIDTWEDTVKLVPPNYTVTPFQHFVSYKDITNSHNLSTPFPFPFKRTPPFSFLNNPEDIHKVLSMTIYGDFSIQKSRDSWYVGSLEGIKLNTLQRNNLERNLKLKKQNYIYASILPFVLFALYQNNNDNTIVKLCYVPSVREPIES